MFIFENVRIFNGTAGRLSRPSYVLIVGNVIKTISSTPIADPAGTTVQRIRGDGHTLMPGLIDNHWHTMFARTTPAQGLEGDIGYTNFVAGAEATATLMRGFTSVRDLGGPSFGLKRAIDERLVVGPRIYAPVHRGGTVEKPAALALSERPSWSITSVGGRCVIDRESAGTRGRGVARIGRTRPVRGRGPRW